MNKSDLIATISERADITKNAAERALNAITDTITDELAKGNNVVLVGFGSFDVKQREARTGRNPQTGDPIEIKASKLPTFKAGKGLKDAVNA